MGKYTDCNMLSLDALSFDRHFNDCMKCCHEGQLIGNVHSIFNRVINIVDKKGMMLSIASKEIDNAPFTIRVNNMGEIRFRDLNIKVGSLVTKYKNSVRIDDKLNINFFKAVQWLTNKPVIKTIPVETVVKSISFYNNVLAAAGASGGCKYFYIKNYLKDYNYNPNIIEAELSSAIEVFFRGIGKGSGKNITGLIGLGAGLTPSGDDFVTGFITVLASVDIPFVHDIFSNLTRDIKMDAVSTTDISKQMIFSAVNGESRENIYNFIHALITGKPSELEESIPKVLSIGSSSGTDLSIGVVTAFLYIISVLREV